MTPFLSAASLSFDSGSSEEIASRIDDAVQKKIKDKNTLASLAKVLQDSNNTVHVRERAAWALGELQSSAHVPILITAAKDKGLLVRSAALDALIQLRARAALPTFIAIAEGDPVLGLRKKATVGLGLLQSEKAIQPLVKLSSDEREEVRGASALAMAATHTTKNNFSEALKEMTADPSPYVQQRANDGLKITSRKNATVRTLLKSEDTDTRMFAGLYFQSQGSSADLPALQEAKAGEPDADLRQQFDVSIKAIKSRAAKAAAEAKRKAAAAAQKKKAAATTPK